MEKSIRIQVEVLNVTQTWETSDFSPSGHQTYRSWRRVLRTMYSTLLLRSCAQKLPKTLPWDPGDSRKSGKLSISDPRKNHILINFLTLLLTTLYFNTTPEKLSCYTKMTKSGAKDIILKSLSKLKLKYSMSRKLVKPWFQPFGPPDFQKLEESASHH